MYGAPAFEPAIEIVATEAGDETIEVDGTRPGPLALIDLRNRFRKSEGTEFKITAHRKNMRGVLTIVLRRMVEP